MRVVLDTNLWSSMDDGSLPHFNALLDEWDLQVQVLPSTLLEIVDIPHEHVRKALVVALARGYRRTRVRTEADMFGEEVVALIRRTRPEWMLQVPSPALATKHRNFWLKKVWSNALEDSTAMHEYQAKQKPLKTHVLDRQKHHHEELNRTKFAMGNLTELVGEHQDFGEGIADDHTYLKGRLPGWDGSRRAAWRLNLAQLTWHHLGVIGPRAHITREDRTMTDWVEPWVDLKKVRREPERFVSMWLDEAEIAEVPRNWLNWAVDAVQWTWKPAKGNPADAQHASYLVDADLFLTADARFIEALQRVREEAPFEFARTLKVDGERKRPTAERIELALREDASAVKTT